MKKIIIILGLSILSGIIQAADVQLLDVKIRSIYGNKAQLLLEFSETPQSPEGFALDNPAKMVFDFTSIKSALPQKKESQNISVGVIKGFNFIETDEKLRLVVNVVNIVPYEISQDRNKVVITLDNDVVLPNEKSAVGAASTEKYTITSLDFRRGDSGEGRVILEFRDDTVPIDFREDGDKIFVEFRGATIPESLQRKFDVKDFGTNITQLMLRQEENDVVLQVQAKGEYDKAAFQLEDQFIVEVRPLTENELRTKASQKFKFTGEKISLNFQDIEVRSVLQLLADFTGMNIVASDTVSGNVTLRLENIPWDQALDFILKSKGLSKREERGLILIAPNEEIAAREQLELEAAQQSETLSQLYSEFIQVNYAKAADIASTLKSAENTILSGRGQVSVDERTNIILLKDTAEKIIEIKSLLNKLDVPVRQVMIEAQMVEIKDIFTEAFGIRFGGAATPQFGRNVLGIGPLMTEARTFADDTTAKSTANNNLFFDFAESSAKGKLGLALAKLPGGTLLDLELQASELEDKTNTIARPKLLTLDQQTATIEQGSDLPYVTTGTAGTTQTTIFRKAVLKLDVTPQITPDDKIAIELTVNQDTPGSDFNGTSAIDTTSLTTNVLVDNGETVVLGGIFKIKETAQKNRLPYFSDIPLIGRLFRGGNTRNEKTEVLVFVTPRIVKQLAQLSQ